MPKLDTPRRPLLRAALLALISLLVLLAVPGAAHASGSVTLSNSAPEETSSNRWKLKMTMNMGGAPDLPHVPMLFVFTPMVLYERALEDKTGDKPILNRKPLVNQSPINESIDVDFSSGGKIWPTTKFDFEIRRDRGYEAGEYTLVVKREADGVQIGQKLTLRLMGDNPIVDRRAIVFSGEKKKKVDPDAKSSGGDSDAGAPAGGDAPAASSDPAAGDPPAAAPGDPDPSAPPAVPPKQGGCGCRIASDSSPVGAFPLAALAVALLLRRRRR